MEGNNGRATRTTILTAMFLVVLMLGVPMFMMDGAGPGISAVDDAAAFGPGDRVLRVGWPELQADIQTLNPLTYTMGAEYMVIWPCYSFVLSRDVDNNIIGDLATDWDLSADGLTWHIKIVPSASFFDKLTPTVQVPLTVHDIIFTYWLIQNTTDNYLQYYFPEIPGLGGRLIEDMWAVNNFEMYVKMRTQYSPFVSALSTIPILPKYIWSEVAWDWDCYDTDHPSPLVGSGAFYYGLNAEPDAGSAPMHKNPTWFGEIEYGWQVHVDTLLLKSETEDSLYTNYLAEELDVITGPTPSQFNDPDLPGSKWTSSQGFVFEFNMNQLTVADRELYDIGKALSYNDQLLLNQVVKDALMMSIDKQGIVDSALGGLGKPADTLMPEVSTWRYDYGGPDALPGEVEYPFDTYNARMLLYANGWKYRQTGTEILSTDVDYLTYFPLSKLIGGYVSDTLAFRFYTPNTDSYFTESSLLIEGWAEETGVDLQYAAIPSGTINSYWYDADYDTWFWDWWFTPGAEPSVDVMQVLATEAIGSWSDVYWSNATYDALYYESLTESDPVERGLILDDLQRMAYKYSGCFPVAWMDMLYAAQTIGPEYWTNWGDWTADYPMVVDSGYPWLFTQIYPEENPAPQITGWQDPYYTDTLTAVDFSATVVDSGFPATLEYRWNFGDGTKSAWLSSASVSHLYPVDGEYTAWLMVREVGTADAFMTSKKTSVVVLDYSNFAPFGTSFTYSPSDPDSGTLVYLNGTASDVNPGDTLVYSWDFGDGDVGGGQNVVHQFTDGDPSYTVTMYVDDGHLGTESRPVETSRLIAVGPNSPPTIVAQDEPWVGTKTEFTFTVASSDADSRDTLRYTWDWGDNSPVTVTYTETAVHTYTQKLTFTLTVWCDDLTGLEGHNVSDTASITVVSETNYQPVIVDFHVSNDAPPVYETVTFYGTATDGDGDLLWYTWDFGDGTIGTSVQTSPNTTLTMDHVYTTVGGVFAFLYVYDGMANVTTMDPLIIDVLPPTNVPPVIDPLPDVIATVSVAEQFSASATDGDVGDTLTYTWDFNDGTPLQVGNPVMHTYAVSSSVFGTLYTVYVDDGQGHNESASALAFVNWIPYFQGPLSDMDVTGGVSDDYTVSVGDNDSSDTLTVTWDFGDGSAMLVGPTVSYAYAEVAVPTMFTLTVYVEDDFDDPAVSHEVSSSATVTVNPPGDTEAPVADAGLDQDALAGDVVTFNGGGSTDNVGVVNWTWTFTWNSVSVDLWGPAPTFTFDIPFVDVTVTLTVRDEAGNTDTDEMIVHVGDWIPEIPAVVLPVAGMIVIVAAALVIRRRKEQ